MVVLKHLWAKPKYKKVPTPLIPSKTVQIFEMSFIILNKNTFLLSCRVSEIFKISNI